MAIEYLTKEYEKVRGDSWTFQKYQLESEIEKKCFDYENTLYKQKMAQKRMQDFWQSIQIGGLWAVGILFFPFFTIQLENVSRLIAMLSWVACPFLIGWALVCFVYTLGKIKFGFSYKERKRALEQEEILVANKALELHKLELELKKYSEPVEVSSKECIQMQNEELCLEHEREREERQRQMRLHVLRMQLGRANRVEKMLETEIESMEKEENILREKELTHRRFLIGSLLGEGIGLIFLGIPVLFIEVACSAWCLLLPPFVIFPVLCLWLRARMELSAGEELWINRVFLHYFYENSFQKRRQDVIEKIVQQQKEIEELEREMSRLVSKSISGCEMLKKNKEKFSKKNAEKQ